MHPLKNYQYIAGVDEVGRGPLAGPVVAAAVVFDSNYLKNSGNWIDGIRDSKKMTPWQREKALADILQHALCYGIGIASHELVDEVNILRASLIAMNEAIESCAYEPKMVLVDGMHQIPYIQYPQKAIIKGDSSVFHIGAASIIAKVIRDNMMLEYHEQYPNYGFDKHKGYGTLFHRQMIQKYGQCPVHRKSFTISFRVEE